MNTNITVITGRMTKSLELKMIASSGMAIGNGTIAVNGMKKDDVSFIDFTVFGKTAEAIANYTDKGSKICITGYIKQDRWEKDGQKRSKLNVIANRIEMLDSKQESKAAAPTDNFEDLFQPADGEDIGF